MPRYLTLINAAFPRGTKRGELWAIILESMRIVRAEGIVPLLGYAVEKLARGELTVLEDLSDFPSISFPAGSFVVASGGTRVGSDGYIRFQCRSETRPKSRGGV